MSVSTSRNTRRARARRSLLRLETLESRHLLATIIPGLLGNDLTDINNDINDNVPANPPYFATGYDFLSANASLKPYFSPGGPENESALNVFDNKTGGGGDKFCCQDIGAAARPDLNNPGAGTAFIDVSFGNARYVLTHFTITSGNDTPDRDADQWRILGSNDGINFTPIYTYNNDGVSSFTGRSQTMRYNGAGGDFTTPVAYSIFRYQAYSQVATGNGGHQLGEIEYFGTPETVYVDDSWSALPIGTRVPDGDFGTAGVQDAVIGANAFATLASAIAATTTNGTIIVNGGIYNESVALNGAKTLRLTGDTPVTPSTVTISSLDTLGGTLVDLQANALQVGDNTGNNNIIGVIQGAGSLTKLGSDTLVLSGVNTYTGATNIAAGTLSIMPAFQYYRFVSTALLGPAPNSIQLSEMQVFSGGTQLTGATATNPGGSNPPNEQPANAVDNNTGTKWLDFNQQPLVLNYGSQRAADGFRWFTANDSPPRSPVRWRFEGSNDGNNWTVLQDQTAADYPTSTAPFTQVPNAPASVFSFSGNMNVLPNASAVNIAVGATLNINNFNETIGSLSGAGNITLGSGTITVNNTANTSYSGLISGSGGLVKQGAGTLLLNSASTYTGATLLQAGALGGSGALASALTASAATTITPGNLVGMFTTGPAVLGASTLAIELGSPSYDRLNVNGNVNLTGATLAVSSSIVADSGQVFTIVTGTSITGTFANLPNNNDKITIGGQVFRIIYNPTNVQLVLNEGVEAVDYNFGPTIVNQDFSENLLTEVIDPDGDAVVIDVTQPPANQGTVVWDADGNFTFTPEQDFAGNAVFTYTISDGDSESTATVTILVSHIALVGDDLYIVGNENRPDRIVVSLSGRGGVTATLNNAKQLALSPEDGGRIIVLGLGGNDTISIAASLRADVWIDGGEGNDYVAGGVGNDILIGGLGNDRLIGGGGDDVMFGDQSEDGETPLDSDDDGRDTLAGGAGHDTMYGQGNNDILTGDAGNDTLIGGFGNDRLTGGTGNDRLYGGDMSGENTSSFSDNDTLDGGAGADLLMGEAGSDLMYGRAGSDVLIGGRDADTLYGDQESDLLLGDDLDVLTAEEIYQMWLTTGISDIDNISDVLVAAVNPDDALDNLTGATGSDWFLSYEFAPDAFDKIRDFKSGDRKSLNGELQP